jgi:hypothetical protein
MKRVLLSAVAFLLLGVSTARGDVRLPPPPPKPPTKPTKPGFDTTTVVAGATATAGVVLAGVWLIRSRRRIQVQS